MIIKAIIISYDSGAYTVVVQPVGSLGTFWKDIPVAITIPGTDCTTGNYCAVASFNESNPTDAVVIAVCGVANRPSKLRSRLL